MKNKTNTNIKYFIIGFIVCTIIGYIFFSTNSQNQDTKITELKQQLFYESNTIESAREYRIIEDYRSPPNEPYFLVWVAGVFLVGVSTLIHGFNIITININKGDNKK